MTSQVSLLSSDTLGDTLRLLGGVWLVQVFMGWGLMARVTGVYPKGKGCRIYCSSLDHCRYGLLLSCLFHDLSLQAVLLPPAFSE